MITMRNPLKSAMAEFNRMENKKNKSAKEVEHFLKEAKLAKSEKSTLFTQHFQQQLQHLLRLITQFTTAKKPVLFVSYEDLKQNLLAQLFRITHFMNLGEDENILERSVCTALSQSRTKKQTKRVYRVDFAKEVGTYIDKKLAIQVLRKIDEIFRKSRTYEMRTNEYISQIEKHELSF